MLPQQPGRKSSKFGAGVQTARPPRSTLAYPPASASRRAASASMPLDMSGSIGVGRVGIVGFFGGCGGGIIAGGNGSGMGTGYGVRGTGYGARSAASAAATGAVATAAAATTAAAAAAAAVAVATARVVGALAASAASAVVPAFHGGWGWRRRRPRRRGRRRRRRRRRWSWAAASRRRRRRRRRAGGEGPQREAESPQQEGRTPLPRGPDTRNRTSNPDSWVLPGRTTTGGEARSPRARPPHPMGSRGKLRPSGQPREGGQTAA